MKIKLLVIGKSTSRHTKAIEDEYIKRLSRFCDLEYTIIPAVKNAAHLQPIEIKNKTSESIFQQLEKSDVVFLLDEKGNTYSSIDFAKFLEQKNRQHGGKRLVFVVGGAYGFDEAIKKQAQGMVSLSSMTFSHQIIRPLFLEQLYRAFTIIKGHPYHNN